MLKKSVLRYKITRRLLLLAIFLTPFLILVWFVTTFSVNVLQGGDQLVIVDLFAKVASGTATFQDFFAQHNEHRIFFPRLIMTALAFTSGWNMQYELLVSIALATLIFFILHKIALNQVEPQDKNLWITNISTCFIIFSLIQWGNWLWGFQIAWFLVNACLVIAIFVLLPDNHINSIRIKLTVAALSCFVASFSLAHGLLTWLAVIPSLALLAKSHRQTVKIILFWLSLFAMSCYAYFINYQKPSYEPDVLFFLKEPFVAIQYLFTLLGFPLSINSSFAILLGVIVFLTFIYFSAYSLRRFDTKFYQNASPWLSLGLFVILFSLITTLGRSGSVVEQARSLRYTSVTILLLVALINLWRLLLNNLSTKSDFARNISDRSFSSKLALISGFLTLLVLASSVASLEGIEKVKANLQYNQACLEVVNYVERSQNNCLSLIFPDESFVREKARILSQIGFRDVPNNLKFVEQPIKTYGFIDTPPDGVSSVVKKDCINCGIVTIGGWAILPDEGVSPSLVRLSYGDGIGTVLTTAQVDLPSPDVAKAFHSSRYSNARWQAVFPPELLPPGETVLKAWAYSSNNKQFVRLVGIPKVRVEE